MSDPRTQAIRSVVTNLLTRDPARRMAFVYLGLSIDDTFFRIVYGLTLLSAPNIVRSRGRDAPLDFAVVTNLDPDAGAQYDPDSNTVQLRRFDYGRTTDERAGLVHELVHAGLDCIHSPMRGLDDEAAAYIAGSIYRLQAGLPSREGTVGAENHPEDTVFSISDGIANRILTQPGTSRTQPYPVVSQVERDNLTSAVWNTPLYVRTLNSQPSAATAGGGRNARYNNNGVT